MMIRLGTTTFNDSVKKMSFTAFCKLYDNPAFLFELRQLGLDLQGAYTQITGKEPEKIPQKDVKTEVKK